MKKVKLKYLIVALAAVCLPLMNNAQTSATGTADPYYLDRIFTGILIGFAAAVVVMAIGVLYKLLAVMIKVQQIRIYQEQGLEAYLKELDKPRTDWWQKLRQRWEGAVPVEQEEEILFEHSFDGIRELDNKLPPWWVAMFYITIAWAIGYYGYYHFTDLGKSSIEQYEQDMAKAQEAVAAFRAKSADLVNESNVIALNDEASLNAGKMVFTNFCAACHGQGGEGGVGPNFSDDYWIHGCSVKDVFSTIKYGVPEKGMISWKSQLRPAEMQNVASYILTLKGTNPPNPKEPQGEICQSENVTESTDGSEQLGQNE